MMTSARGLYDIRLRDVEMDDLPIFFEHQCDPDANHMAALTRKEPADRDAFRAYWTTILEDEANTIQTILFNGRVSVPERQTELLFWLNPDKATA